jgi:hypothetical protein
MLAGVAAGVASAHAAGRHGGWHERPCRTQPLWLAGAAVGEQRVQAPCIHYWGLQGSISKLHISGWSAFKAFRHRVHCMPVA